MYSWVEKKLQGEQSEATTVKDVVGNINKGLIKALNQIPSHLREEIETMLRVGRITQKNNPKTYDNLLSIGFVI